MYEFVGYTPEQKGFSVEGAAKSVLEKAFEVFISNHQKAVTLESGQDVLCNYSHTDALNGHLVSVDKFNISTRTDLQHYYRRADVELIDKNEDGEDLVRAQVGITYYWQQNKIEIDGQNMDLLLIHNKFVTVMQKQ